VQLLSSEAPQQCSSSAMQLSSSSSAAPQQCSSSAVQLLSSAAPQQCSSLAMQLLNSAAPQQCSSSAVQLLSSAAPLQCSSSAMQLLNNAAPITSIVPPYHIHGPSLSHPWLLQLHPWLPAAPDAPQHVRVGGKIQQTLHLLFNGQAVLRESSSYVVRRVPHQHFLKELVMRLAAVT